MILLDDNFASIVNGVQEGRVLFDNLKKTIAYVTTANIPQIVPVFLNIIAFLPVYLTTILDLCICVGTDMLPAVSLSYEKAESDIMKRRPRDPVVDRLVNGRLIAFAYVQLGMVQAISNFLVFFVVMGNLGFYAGAMFGTANCWTTNDKIMVFQDSTGMYVERDYNYRRDALHYANGACFMAVVVNQWATLLCCKTRKRSLFQQGMKNWLLNIGIIEETLLVVLVLYVPPFNFVFGTRPVNIIYWFIPLPFSLFMLAYDETRKYFLRKQDTRIGQWVEEFTFY